jgi:hypothetical protein
MPDLRCKRMRNIENLQYIRDYLESANDCVKYLRELGQANAE